MAADERDGDEEKGGTGTRMSSTFTLINAAVGTGMLTIPYSLTDAGVIPGLLCIVLYGAASAASLHVLVKSAHVSRVTSLPQLFGTYLGGTFQLVFEICLALYCLFSCVGCIIVVSDVAQPILSHVLPTSIFADAVWGRMVIRCIGALLMLPLQFLKRINSLRFTAYLAFASIMYICLVVVVHGALRLPSTLHASHVAWFPPAGAPWRFLYAVPNVAIAFQCQIQVVSIYTEMKTSIRSVGSMTTSIACAVLIEVLFYSSAGFFGYFTFLGCTSKDILQANYSVNDYPVELARVAICVVVITQFPVNHFPARKAIYTFLQKTPCMRAGERDTSNHTLKEVLIEGSPEVAPRIFSPAEQPSKQIQLEELPCCYFYAESFLFWAVSLALGLVIPSLEVLFEILGFTMSTTIMFTLPGVVLCKSVSGMHQRAARRRTYKILAVVLVIIGVISAAFSAFDFVLDEIVPLVAGAPPAAVSSANCSSPIAPLFG